MATRGSRIADADTQTPGTRSASVIRNVAPWGFLGYDGQAVVTDHFIIRTTDRSTAIGERLPGMMEAALTHYMTALADLPKPTAPLEMFVLATRTQWQQITLQHLGERGRSLSRIGRGGYTVGGQAFLFDIGPSDTMSIASHEGWHQYTQKTFGESLPIWAEEGIATFMEGHRWTGSGVSFSGWSNIERFDRLREAEGNGTLLPLETILNSSPDQILAMGNDAAVTYYAQVWALTHFLREGEQSKYLGPMQTMLTDAAGGHLGTRVIHTLRTSGQLQQHTDRRGVFLLARTLGSQVFRTYINADLNQAESEYRMFVKRIVATGARQRIVAGQSPISGR